MEMVPTSLQELPKPSRTPGKAKKLFYKTRCCWDKIRKNRYIPYQLFFWVLSGGELFCPSSVSPCGGSSSGKQDAVASCLLEDLGSAWAKAWDRWISAAHDVPIRIQSTTPLKRSWSLPAVNNPPVIQIPPTKTICIYIYIYIHIYIYIVIYSFWEGLRLPPDPPTPG